MLGKSLGPFADRRVAVDGAYIDFFQGARGSQQGLRNCFGMRVWDGGCQAVARIEGCEPSTFGEIYTIPVQFEGLQTYVRMLLDDHMLRYPTSDLMDLLEGKKSFREALGVSKIQPKRTAANSIQRYLNAS